MQKRILFIMHQTTSDPGRIGEAALAYGFEPDICRHFCGDPLPQSIDDYAAVVLFGGPMSANDDHLPAIRAELDWLEMPLREKKPCLGICLGAQMLARVLGGNVMHHERGLHEIGFYKVRAQPDGKNLFDDEQYFYQWHSEGFSMSSVAGDNFGHASMNQKVCVHLDHHGQHLHFECHKKLENILLHEDSQL